MNNQIKIYIANAFTSKDHKTLGNPAAVVINDTLYDTDLMKNIAVYAKQPMTSFLVPEADQNNAYTLRYYDLLGQETHICGHATVAATQVLIDNGQAKAGDEITFHLNPDLFEGQETSVTTSIDDNNNISITMPASQLEERNDDPVLLETVAKALRIDSDHIDSISFSTNIRDFVVGIKDPYVLETMEPDFEFMKQMAAEGEYSHEGLMVSALSDDEQWDLKVRVFLPITGVNEDIACGSGNCSIIPYWYAKGMKQNDPTFQSVFTYPNDPENLGGIQEVSLDPKAQKVTIKSQAQSGKSFFFNLSNPLKRALTLG
jgi:PhzF family phenazine biosynthesis protein